MSLNAGVDATSHQSNSTVVLNGITMPHEALRKVHDLLVAKFHADLGSVREKQIGGAKELIFEGTCKEGGVRIDDGRDLRRLSQAACLGSKFIRRLHARRTGELAVSARDRTPWAERSAAILAVAGGNTAV